MQKTDRYTFGPLIWLLPEDDESLGNYYWSGRPPVGYDKIGIPIDDNGNQCLDIRCPLHPHYHPGSQHLVHNPQVNDMIPTVESFKDWFDDHFLIVDDRKLKRYILRWYGNSLRRGNKTFEFWKLRNECKTIDEMVDKVWPDETT